MHADFSKRPFAFLVSLTKKYRQVRVIECPPNFSPQKDINSNPSPNLKDDPNTNINPKVTNRWFTLRLSRTLHGVYQN